MDQQQSSVVSTVTQQIEAKGGQLTLKDLRAFVGITKDWPDGTRVIGEVNGATQRDGAYFNLKVQHPFPEPLMGYADGGPHSRSCGIRPHEHGLACKMDCPTCHGAEGWQAGAV